MTGERIATDNPLAQFLRQQSAERERIVPDPLLPEHTPQSPLQWNVRPCEPPDQAQHRPTLSQARETIRREINNYLDMENPSHILLIRASAGLGKTTAGVQTAEASAARGRHVAYVGPRHDFFDDVTEIAREQSWWYEWLPRQEGNEEKGSARTCEYVPQINSWLEKGYKGIDFCSRVCGWEYVNNKCVYHAQKRRNEPIIFLQHAHAAVGHPLEFSVMVGDENPMQAFLHEWEIPASRVMPKGMDVEDPLTEIIYHLRTLAETDYLYHGPELLEALGGAAGVKEAAELFVMSADRLASPSIHSAYEADQMDYAHLPHLVPLLAREAEAALSGHKYPERIWVGKGKLNLLLRRAPAERLPSHIVWLDATGDEHIYAALFDRPVKVIDAAPQMAGEVIVIADRANGKSSLSDGAAVTAKFNEDARQIVQRIVADEGLENPGLITFKQLLDQEWVKQFLSANFYGARGTNRFEGVDGLFIIGAPLPRKWEMQKIASMIFFNRMRSFESPWTWQWVTYNHVAEDGQGRQYPAGNYWGDADLKSIVWQFREAEILQAAHRARPLHRNVPVYLLVNVPIEQLPVNRILTAREVLDVPEGINIHQWLRFMAWLGTRESVTAKEIEEGFDVAHGTALKYRDALGATPGWQVAAMKTNRRGMPPKAAFRTIANSV